MQVLQPETFSVAAVPSLASPDGPELTVVAKSTWRLVPDGVAEPAEEPLPPTGDVFEEGDRLRRLLYPADFAPFKPNADLLLVGTAHSPGGAPVSELDVTFRVGDVGRTLRVTGDREWSGRLFGRRRPSDPLPFSEMPIGYDRSFGGPSFPDNPLGRGGERVENDRGRRRQPLPNVEDPAARVRSPGTQVDPAGFGPIPDTWPQRAEKAGRFSRRYREEHWPALPPDFDWSYFNAAPAALQCGYLRGDEWIELSHLHPQRPTYRCRLPGLRVRCFLKDTRENGEERVRETTMRLDTLWVDPEAEALVLVWRGRPGIRTREAEEIEKLWVASEPLADEPLAAAEWIERLEAEGEEAAPAPEPEPELDEEEKAVLAKLTSELDKLKQQMIAGGVPPGLVARLDSLEDPEDFLGPFFEHCGVDPEQGRRLRAETESRFAKLLEDAGADPSFLEDLGGPPEPDAATLREVVEARYAAGGSLAEEDLSGVDLSGAELPGIDLRESILTDANLEGANLEGADLTRASLGGANLANARLGRARLDGADLSKADASGADLSGATFEWAIADRTRFCDARMAGIEGPGLRAAEADFSRADLSSAKLPSANLESSVLDRTILAGALLEEASLQKSRGLETDLRGADGTRLRVSDGARLASARCAGLVAPRSMWADADLAGSDFAGCDLAGSDFSGCSLRGATFTGSDLRGANLSKSELDEAICAEANFFEGNFYAAKMGRADFTGANLFGAETDDAAFDEAILEGANIARTQLET
ncbi:MAG: DUF2169 family type VI secretion system accessory protein [Myxococcota bacterium]